MKKLKLNWKLYNKIKFFLLNYCNSIFFYWINDLFKKIKYGSRSSWRDLSKKFEKYFDKDGQLYFLLGEFFDFLKLYYYFFWYVFSIIIFFFDLYLFLKIVEWDFGILILNLFSEFLLQTFFLFFPQLDINFIKYFEVYEASIEFPDLNDHIYDDFFIDGTNIGHIMYILDYVKFLEKYDALWLGNSLYGRMCLFIHDVFLICHVEICKPDPNYSEVPDNVIFRPVKLPYYRNYFIRTSYKWRSFLDIIGRFLLYFKFSIFESRSYQEYLDVTKCRRSDFSLFFTVYFFIVFFDGIRYFLFKNFFQIFLILFVVGFLILLLVYNSYDIKNLRLEAIYYFNVIFFFYFLLYCLSYKKYFSYFCIFTNFNLDLINLNFTFALDNLSLLFILLTCFLFNLSLLVSLYSVKYKFKLFILNLIVLQFLIILTFLSLNVILFYIFFEISLLPMFILIGLWGSRQRKIFAVYQFFYYTLFGSIFLFAAILILYSTCYTLDIQILMNSFIEQDRQLLIWILLFIGFSTKIPLIPFHGWLPEAHVEAPTAGSVILAGILLKLGTYGLLRFVLPVYPFANYFYLPYIYTLSIISIIYISMIILVQLDLKKIIAYSSISHMNFIILGLFSFTISGLGGGIFLMFSHALISSGLFICVGILYDRYKTRNIIYYGSLATFMPLFSIMFFLLTLANMSFPLTSNFIGELLVCVGLIENNIFLTFLLVISTFLNAVYSIWLFNRICFGVNKYLYQVSDISEREFFILGSLIFWIFFLGIQPGLILNSLLNYIYWILEYIKF